MCAGGVSHETHAIDGDGHPGVYLVDTGSTGVVEAFGVMGLTYSAVMAVAAYSYRLPAVMAIAAPLPDDNQTLLSATESAAPPAEEFSVPVSVATRSPQFVMLCVARFLPAKL